VAGTLVYGRGDEEASQLEIAEAVAAGLIPAPIDAVESAAAAGATVTTPLLATATTPIPAAARSTPVGIRGSFTGGLDGGLASPAHHVLGSSLKATMTITHGSYSRSLTAYGSLPRGSFGGPGGLARSIRERRAGSGLGGAADGATDD